MKDQSFDGSDNVSIIRRFTQVRTDSRRVCADSRRVRADSRRIRDGFAPSSHGFATGLRKFATDSRRVRTSSHKFAPDITQFRGANARRGHVTSPVGRHRRPEKHAVCSQPVTWSRRTVRVHWRNADQHRVTCGTLRAIAFSGCVPWVASGAAAAFLPSSCQASKES